MIDSLHAHCPICRVLDSRLWNGGCRVISTAVRSALSKATTEAVRAMAWLGRRERGVT
jgi:hypothetical protein